MILPGPADQGLQFFEAHQQAFSKLTRTIAAMPAEPRGCRQTAAPDGMRELHLFYQGRQRSTQAMGELQIPPSSAGGGLDRDDIRWGVSGVRGAQRSPTPRSSPS